MALKKKAKANKATKAPVAAGKLSTSAAPALGRKRDTALDGQILDSAIAILSEVGFDSMTMDAVAARAGAGKTTVYRRWPSKAELVRDALIFMSLSSADTENLPDTGNLRADLLGVTKEHTPELSTRKLRVLAGLGSFMSEHRKYADETMVGIFGPLNAANRTLMERAKKRGEIPPNADITLACDVIASMTSYRTVTQNKPFDKAFYSSLLDNILLPALKGAGAKSV